MVLFSDSGPLSLTKSKTRPVARQPMVILGPLSFWQYLTALPNRLSSNCKALLSLISNCGNSPITSAVIPVFSLQPDEA